MKKNIVALAALASVSAFAQSSVTLTGLADLGYGRIDYKGNQVSFSSLPNGSATTNFTFLVSEDLGNGMKADLRWELDPDLTQTVGKTSGTSSTGTTSNVTSSIGNGYSFLGLSGGFGALKLGTINFETLNANGDGNAGFGTAIGSGYRVSSFDAVRAQNSLRYDTPNMNGFSASYLMSEKNDLQANTLTTGMTGNLVNQTVGRDKVSELGLVYSKGPLTARYAQLTTEQWGDIATTYTTAGSAFNITGWTNGAGAQFRLNTLSVKYDVSPAITVAYFGQKVSSDAIIVANTAATAASSVTYDRNANGFAAAYTNGATKFMLNYVNVKNGDAATKAAATSSASTTSLAGYSAKVLGLGVDYSLSKRTTIYGRHERDTDSTATFRSITGYTAATNNVTYTATAIGIRHTF